MAANSKTSHEVTSGRDELSGAVRTMAKRARSMAASAAERGVSMRFKKAMDDAATILEAAAEVLTVATTPIPELRRTGEDAPIGASQPSFIPAKVAGAMSQALNSRGAAPSLLPPHEAQVQNCLRGSTSTMTIADLLGLLGGMGKSGVLWVQSSGETFSIVLTEGIVVHAASDRSPPGLRLGEILIEQRAITQEKFELFLERFKTAGGKLGGALEREELVTRAQLAAALEFQVHKLFERMMAQKNATFLFSERPSESSEHCLRISVPMLLLESARSQDNKDNADAKASKGS